MKIRYEFVNGEVSEVEVDGALSELLLELERKEYNVNHKETRRHCSLEALNLDEGLLPSDEDVVVSIFASEDRQQLYNAISQLTPDQQDLIRAIFFDEVSVSDYAKQCGVSQPAMSQRKATAIRNLRKLFT